RELAAGLIHRVAVAGRARQRQRRAESTVWLLAEKTQIGDGNLIAAAQLIQRILLRAVVMVVTQAGAQGDPVRRLVAVVRIHRPAIANLIEGIEVVAAEIDVRADVVAAARAERTRRAI